MGIPANPPPQSRLPEKLLQDDELRAFFTVQQEDMYRLWLRSGGGTDLVSVIGPRLDALELRMTLLEARVTYLEGTIVVTAIDVTASGNTTIICTAAVTVTLAAAPLDKDLVSIKAINGDKIIINGNGKTVEGDTTLTIRQNRASKIKAGLTMRYSSSINTWVLV